MGILHSTHSKLAHSAFLAYQTPYTNTNTDMVTVLICEGGGGGGGGGDVVQFLFCHCIYMPSPPFCNSVSKHVNVSNWRLCDNNCPDPKKEGRMYVSSIIS